ncbi:MAG TPA: hypothetical protein PKH07_08210 [bacterium]|nr:hypothetical protein [bacterium]
MSTWFLHPRNFQEKIHLPLDFSDPELGFFHVTSHAARLQKSWQYRSRLELRSEGIVGLSGGPQDAPNKISFILELDRAKTLLHAIRTMSRACHDQISIRDLLSTMFDWLDFPDCSGWEFAMMNVFGLDEESCSMVDYNEDTESFLKSLLNAILVDESLVSPELLTSSGWRNLLKGLGKDWENQFIYPINRYDAARAFETVLEKVLGDEYVGAGEIPGICVPIVGFVAPFEDFLRVQPDDICITQAAVKEGASIETNYGECEVRLFPKEVKLVAMRVEERGIFMEDQTD